MNSTNNSIMSGGLFKRCSSIFIESGFGNLHNYGREARLESLSKIRHLISHTPSARPPEHLVLRPPVGCRAIRHAPRPGKGLSDDGAFVVSEKSTGTLSQICISPTPPLSLNLNISIHRGAPTAPMNPEISPK